MLVGAAAEKNRERSRRYEAAHLLERRVRSREDAKRRRAADPEFAAKNAAGLATWAKKNPERRNEAQRLWKSKNKSKLRAYKLKQKYKIDHVEYDRMLEMQGRRCAICRGAGEETERFPLDVDHCHETLVVRGLLCRSCNMALGAFKDNTRLLMAAAEYLAASNREWP